MMNFSVDNKIPYMQDMAFGRGIPSGIDFEVDEYSPGNCRLSAYGYGVLGRGGKAYGNGALLVKKEDLTGEWPPYSYKIQAKEDWYDEWL